MNDEILISEIGSKRVLQLNRPKLMNAYNSYMIKKLGECLEEWQIDPTVQLVIVKGNDRAFSSGGEIRDVAGFGDHVDHLIKYSIKSFSKPYVALVDGVAMGGGLGLAVNGQFIVATERAIAAMPEAVVGYYPDAGAAHFLKGNFGLFMALTGFRLKGADIYHVGLASHYTKSSNLVTLEQHLLSIPENSINEENVKSVLSKFHERSLPPFSLKPYSEEIENSFSKNSVESIVESLQSKNSEFSQKVLKDLLKISPTSLKVTFQHFTTAKNLTFEDLMDVEYRLTQRFVKEHDFYEGVRAMLIEKDRKPKWKPCRLEDVSQEIVDSYFIKKISKNDINQTFLESKL
uniref:3-hydroxyisobutyryl-CoA hydrolase, mitochondrial n=1 Tax=Acrobeloides nanus TaxID=290746 RepID=A0A914C7L6_9BILA